MSLLTYALFRLFTLPLSYLSWRRLHSLGALLGKLTYNLYPKYRKRALANIAFALKLPAERVEKLAKASLQNLLMTALEYPRLARKGIEGLAVNENPEVAGRLLEAGQGVIFFCGHQTNWEVFFLDGARRFGGKGAAIGRPIKNNYLYDWVKRLREQFGGEITPPKNALKKGLKILKGGGFFGIVGDQGMPDSGYTSPFLGRRAWTSPLPALLALRTGAPIIVATGRRVKDQIHIRYEEPIWPHDGETVDTLMRKTLALFEASVRRRAEEWLWIHNRWKQRLAGDLPKELRHETIAVIDPTEEELGKIKERHPLEFITLFLPEGREEFEAGGCEVRRYRDEDDLLRLKEYGFKLVYDGTESKRVKRHFLRLGAFTVVEIRKRRDLPERIALDPLKSDSA